MKRGEMSHLEDVESPPEDSDDLFCEGGSAISVRVITVRSALIFITALERDLKKYSRS